jgi:hypothetical protein
MYTRRTWVFGFRGASFAPAGFVLNTLAGTEGEDREIATGEYNKRIDAHIALIKSTCGID